MQRPALTATQQEEAERIYTILKEQGERALRELAELLASKPDERLLGATEFEVRDRVHALGAKAIQTALSERKKGGTKAAVAPAPGAAAAPNSNAGRPRPGSAP